MAEESAKAHISQHLTVDIEIIVEEKRRYVFCMPYGTSFKEAYAVAQQVAKAIEEMAENAKKQAEEKKGEEDAKE